MKGWNDAFLQCFTIFPVAFVEHAITYFIVKLTTFSPLITFDLSPRMSFYSWILSRKNECEHGTKRYSRISNCEHGELIEIQPLAEHIITNCSRHSKHHSNQFITIARVSNKQVGAPPPKLTNRFALIFFISIFVVAFVGEDDYVLLIRFCDSSANGIGSDRFNFFDMKCPVGFVTE